MGLIIARWLVRLGLQPTPSARAPRSADSALRTQLFDAMRGLETERMVAIFADANGAMLSQELVAQGNTGRLKLSLRQIFAKALARDARRMIVAHNHPSGCAEPSERDIESTARLRAYAESLGIALEDHLIVGSERITSMRSRGLL